VTNEFVPRPIFNSSSVASANVILNGTISTTPSTLNVVPGGCTPTILSLSTSPPSGINVTATSNNTSAFYVQNSAGVNMTTFNFTNNVTAQTTIQICANSTATVGTIGTITYNVSSTNAADYTNGTGTTTVTVINSLGNLNFSTLSVSVPLGGCASPILVTPNNATSNNISIDNSSLLASGYYLASPVSFNTSSAAQNLTICSFANATSNPSLPLVIIGTNSTLYTINSLANANLSITTASAVTPVISITVNSSTSNTTTLNINSN
jgi:hypothetical protein